MPAYKPSRQFPGLSKLPAPIRGLAEAIFPQEPQMPTPVGTTIGPKAIPLTDYGNYLKRVAQETIGELSSVPTKQMPAGIAKRGKLITPALQELMTGVGEATTPQQEESLYRQMIDRLSDIYHGF